MKGTYKKFQSGNQILYIDADRIEAVEYVVRGDGKRVAYIYLQGRKFSSQFFGDDADAVRDWAENVGKVPPHQRVQSSPSWHGYQSDTISATDPAPGWKD